jgi:capsular polysaccharide transport system permease protein
LNGTSLSERLEKDSTSEARAAAVTVVTDSVLEQKVGIGVQLPPPLVDDEFVQPRLGFWRRHGLFIATVVLPMTIAAGFLEFVASSRYSSTASFIVRSIDRTATQDMLSSLAKGMASTIASDETFALNAYLTSRDLVDQLARSDNLRDRLSRPQADFLSRYPTFWLPDNREFLYRRFQWLATPSLDPETGITTIEANAFTPADAQALVQAMLDHAEALLNRMNERFYQSQIAAADRFLAEAQKGLDAIEAELKDFRNHSGSIDPNLVAKSKLAVIQGLSAQLAQVEASIAQQLKLAPRAPALAGLRAQAHSYSDEIRKQMLEIAGATGSEAVKLQTYDQLTLQRDFALAALANAVAQRDLARQDAGRQHLYVQVVSKPSLPLDWARYPQTTLDLLMLFAICLGAFQLLRKLRDIALEHRP